MKPLQLVFLFLSFFTFLQTLSSQSDYQKTVIPGAKWTMRKGQGMGSFGYSEIAISCDTFRANGQAYLAVQLLSGVNGASCSLGYVREDVEEQKLYFIPQEHENPEEILIVDYSLEKGDTFVNYRGFEYVVDTVRRIDFFGKTTKFIDFGPLASDGFIVGFGSYMSGPVMNCEGFTNIDDYELLEPNCSQTTSLEDFLFAQTIKISPNPASEQLNVYLEAPEKDVVTLRILSVVGQVLLAKDLHSGNNLINLHQFPKGLLFLEFKQGEKRFMKKLIHKSH